MLPAATGRTRLFQNPRERSKQQSRLDRPNLFESLIPALMSRKRIALVSIVFALICETDCGRYRQHVYQSRIPGHYAAYDKNRKQPPTGDTLDLNENGSCVHRFLRPGEQNSTEQSCTWTLTDKLDGSWLRFEELSDGIHKKCTGSCVVEAAAFDEEFVTRFEFPSTPDIFYAK